MKVRILRSAADDLLSGRQFYNQQQQRIGTYFFESLTADIDRLATSGGIHGLHHGYYRMLARRFPYAIYYRILEGDVVVFRVLDCRRDPKWIRKVLKKPDNE